MKDAINCTYGFGCHCRNCESCVKGTSEDEYWTCAKDILKPGSVNNKSFCSSGVPKKDCNNDPHHDIATAIVKLREDIKTNNATEGYFDVKLKDGKDLKISLYKCSEALEVAGLERRVRLIGDLDLIAMIHDEVQYIDDIRVWVDENKN